MPGSSVGRVTGSGRIFTPEAGSLNSDSSCFLNFSIKADEKKRDIVKMELAFSQNSPIGMINTLGFGGFGKNTNEGKERAGGI